MTLLDRWFSEVWNKGNLSAVDELLSENVIIHNTLDGDGEKTLDLATFKIMLSQLRSELSEVSVTSDLQLHDGDLLAAHCSIKAIYTEGIGCRKRPLNFTGTSIVRTSDGRIIESWNHFDFETMYKQME